MSIYNSLQILKEDNLKDIITNLSDALIQSTFKNSNFLTTLPMVGLAFSAYGAINGIRDVIYLNNVLKFLTETAKTTIEERESFIKGLEEKPKQFERLCVNGVALLASFEDVRKATILGMITKHRIKKSISIDVYLRLSYTISRVFIDDLKYLRSFNFPKIPASYEVNLLSSGLLKDKGIGWNQSRESDKYIDHYQLNEYGNELYRIFNEENFSFD